MFELAMLSARKAETETHEYIRYFITKDPHQLFVLSLDVDSPEVERESGRLVEGSKFLLDNGLIAPNEEDILVLDQALQYGYLDGVAPFER